MKKVRKLLCLIMVLAVMATLTSTAFAENEGVEPCAIGVFGRVSYNTEQRDNTVFSYMKVEANPYNGIIRITQEPQAIGHDYPAVSSQSARGALYHSMTQILPYIATYPPTCVYVYYEVYGSQSAVDEPDANEYYAVNVG